MDGNVVSVERVVAAPAAAIFALLVDPSKHPLIDGSGTVKATKGEPATTLGLGSTFGMSMKLGISYSMLSTIVEFEPDRRIAWQSKPPGLMGRFTAGRIWRYELEAVEGGTRVRESWDISEDHQRALLRLGPTPVKTRENMEKTLARIDEVLAGGSATGSGK